MIICCFAVPGPITNHKIGKDEGIFVEWEPPINPNGILKYYLVEWTINNDTHSANVSVDEKNASGRNSFHFPNTHDEDKFNVTMRAVSDSGIGIPIYMNLENLLLFYNEESVSSISSAHDPRLGIAIGALLSVVCIMVCTWIIIRHRKCTKPTRQPADMNGAGNNHFNQNHHNRTDPSTAELFPLQPTTISANCAVDLHEMQTLMIKTNDVLPVAFNSPNGIIKQNGGNGIFRRSRTPFDDEPSESLDDRTSDDEMLNESRRGLICSTPKSKRGSVCKDDEITTPLMVSILYSNAFRSRIDEWIHFRATHKRTSEIMASTKSITKSTHQFQIIESLTQMRQLMRGHSQMVQQ